MNSFWRISTTAGITIALAAFFCWARTAPAEVGTAPAARVGEDIRFLSSDELEGRGPSTPGLQKAADYMRDEFKRLGLRSGTEDGSYFQKFDIKLEPRLDKADTSLVLHGPDGRQLTLKLGEDFQAQGIGGGGTAKAEVVFAGYGISAPDVNYDDYADLDVEGKVVLLIRKEPRQHSDANSPFREGRPSRHKLIASKLRQAKQAKAAAVLMVNDPFSTKAEDGKDELAQPATFGGNSMGIPFAHLAQDIANKMLESSPLRSPRNERLADLASVEADIDQDLSPISQVLKGWTAELKFSFVDTTIEVANVVGVLEGEGPTADETIVIGAHYDHLGYGPYGSRSRRPQVREVHNGADDNASGTACVLELARRFAAAEAKPARRLVFIGFSGEERGLLGSRYYVENPLFPLEDTIAMINYDMVGRLGEKGLVIGGVQTGKPFADVVTSISKEMDLRIDMSGPTGASDHAAFYRKQVPVMFFFTGLTQEYHTPEDDFELINVDGVVRTIDFTERVVRRLVELPQRPEYAEVTRTRRGPRGGQAYLGAVPDFAGGADNVVKVGSVDEGSPAQQAGIQVGDVFLKIGETEIDSVRAMAAALRRLRPEQKVEIVVKRNDETKTLEVTLGRPGR